MSFLAQYSLIKDEDKSAAVKKLITDSTPDFDYFLLITLSVLMATFGLLINSVAVIIGSMLVAPILSPLLSLSLGIAMSDHKLISRSIFTLLRSLAIAVGFAAIATLFFADGGDWKTSEVLLRTEPNLIAFMVSVVAGFAVSFTLVRPDLGERLPGVAIAVALIPPLAVTGIGIAKLDWAIVSGSMVLLTVNVIGIVFASLLSFSLMNIHGKRHVADQTIKKEEKRMEKEKEIVEEFKEEQAKE